MVTIILIMTVTFYLYVCDVNVMQWMRANCLIMCPSSAVTSTPLWAWSSLYRRKSWGIEKRCVFGNYMGELIFWTWPIVIWRCESAMQDQVEALYMFGVNKTLVTTYKFYRLCYSLSWVGFGAIFSWPLGIDVTFIATWPGMQDRSGTVVWH